MKKYILSFVLMMTMSSIVFSQSAQTIHYQAIVRNATGSVLVNLNVGVRISILCDSIDGTTVYSETHNVNTNQFGLINLSIGAGTVLYGSFSSIDWSNRSYVKTEIDDEGGTDYQLTRITRLLSVPYSLHTSGLIVTDANGISYHVIVDTLGNLITILTDPWYCGELFTDSRDGATYNTIQIGTQCWMAENINIGTRIDGVNDQTDNSIIEKYCYNDIEDSCGVYGGLYLWDEMMQYITTPGAQGICPVGWHIPTDYEWKVLEGTVDSQYPVGDPEWDGTGWRGFDAGLNLKSASDWDGANAFGFSLLPAGRRDPPGGFSTLSSGTTVWSSNDWGRYLSSGNNYVHRDTYNKSYGVSIRCLLDCSPQPSQADAGPDQLNVAGTSTALAGNTPASGTGIWSVISGTGGVIDDSANPTSDFTGLAGNSYELTWSITTACGSSTDTVIISFATGSFTCGDLLTDSRDGKVYTTVEIGTQCWMAENLNLGTRIDGANDQTDNSIFEKYCHSDVEDSCGVYGGLYQWNEMMQYSTFPGTEGICPTGWHIPTDNEWKILEGTVDGQYPVGDPVWDGTGFRGFDAGKNLKSTAGWNTNTGTDLFGFTALPGGIRLEGGGFGGVGDLGYIYSSSLDSSAQSVKVDASSDLLWKLGDKTSGEYVVRFYLYFPSGNYGYYNIQHFEDHDPFESAIDCYFYSDGSGELKAGGQTTAFSYNHDQWFLIEHIINLDSDVANCYINGTFIYTWQWSLQSDGNPGTNQLGAVDFYPNVSGSGVPAYYIDDVYYFDGSSVLNWDDFESYSLASYIAAENPAWWTTWSGTTGGAEDGVIVNDQANSGTYPWYRIMGATLDQVSRTYKFKERGYSVRCLLGECTPQPTQADAGPDQLNVAGTSTALAGNTPASGTGNWSVISGTWGTIADATNPTSNFSGLLGNSYELTWTITTVCGSSADTVTISFAAADGVKKVLSEVAVDGMLDESFWEISSQLLINLGGSDNTAYFGVLWDDDYLYVGVNVIDADLCSNIENAWYDDGVEICIDGNYNQGTGFDEHDRQFIKPINSYWIQEMNGNNEDVLHKWMLTDDGYSMEFAIPWTNFDITPASGVPIGLNVVVNDDDDCDDENNLPSQLLWNGNGNYYQNPSLWGVIVLSDQTVSYSGDYIGIIDPNGGDFLINNKSFIINWVSSGIDNVDIEYSTDNGTSWNPIASNITASSGSYTWNVTATASEQCKIRISDSNNSSFYDVSESTFIISDPLLSVEPLVNDNWQTGHWPYNAYYPVDPDGVNGHVGNSCGPTALSRILHYWEFPIVGNDELTFTDNDGFTWSANFGATTYNYDNMPPYLPFNSTEPKYTDVATLFYHAATSIHDVWGSGTDLANMAYAMSHYFNYDTAQVAIRDAYSRADWIQLLKTELDNGRVLLVAGMTLEVVGNWHEGNNTAGHYYLCDGYNDDGEFHTSMSWGGGGDGYYDANSMSSYAYNLGILTGLEPELNGKELSLLSPDGGEVFSADGDTVITWTSNNISDIKIEYTIDNGENWLEIIASTPAGTGTYTWTVPDTTSYQCKVKLTDVTEINVYDKSDDVFSISPYELILISPNGGECYVPGSSVSIGWENTPVSDIKIEYTTDNGSYWNEITDSTSAVTGSYNWIVPDSVSSQCKVKITDITNGTVYDESDITFEITDETSHALQFDGINDYVEVNNISFPTDDLTIEAWINPNNFDSIQEIVYWYSDNSGAQFRINVDSSLLYGEWGNWNYVTSNSQSLLPNVWTHIAVTKQGDNCNLYINGNHAGYNQFDNNPVAPTLHIGGRPSAMNRFFDGDIDELRIWTVARSQAEIEANMHNYLQGTVTGLYACWRMNEGTGQTAFDLTANDYDGQLGSTAGEDDNDPEWIATYWPYGVGSGFNCGDPFTDPRDSQTYTTVLIGTQCWMAENLNLGTRIDGANDQTDNSIFEKYCHSDVEDSCGVYGGLYQWNEMMQYSTFPGTEGICPTGWHIPTDNEWKILEGTVDGQYPVGDPVWDGTGFRGFDAGKNLKSTVGWNTNTGTDLFGFTALPGGIRLEGGGFGGVGDLGYIYSSSLDSSAQSVKVDASSDLLWKLGDKTSGEYVVSFYLYYPSGNYGYYNIQHFEDHDPFESAIECYFHSDGSGELKAAGQTTAFSYNHDQWFLIEHIINLDSDVASCYINGTFIYTWQWSLQSDGNPGTNQLGAVDFYPNVSGSGVPAYYIDDVYYFDGSSVLNWDDFESYALASYIAAENPAWWTTWSGTTGGAEDGVIVDDQANSGTYPWYRIMGATLDQVSRTYKFKERGYSVRCLLGECTPQPTQADAGPDQLNVEGTSVTLAGNTPTSGTGNWSVISGIGGTITDASSPTTNFSGLPGNSYELAWTITTVCGSSADTVTISFAAADGVKKVLSEVAVDGILEESFWDISNQISINLGGSDNTASFGVLWDDTYLYVGVIVVDGILCTNGRMGWWDDGVEICIDGDYSQGTTFDQYDRHFVKPVKSYWIQEKDGHNEDVIHRWIETNDGYSMEFAIPWSNFNTSPAVGMNIGFNVAINDDDDCILNNYLSQLLWFGDANYYKNSSIWGTLNLSDQTVSYSGDYIALINPNGGDFCINNKTTDINWVSNGITNIDIDYSTDNGSNWNSIAANLPAGLGLFTWNVSATPSDQCLIKISDADNSSVNDISESLFAISAPLTAVEPLIPNIWDNFQWPYNAYYPEDPDGINGHVGNACGHSSLARILHYWEFPIVGNDELTFTDNAGFTWSANFGATTYNYDNMPPYLPFNSTEPEYTDVATLFYHAATSIHDINGSGGDFNKMSYAMSHYFNYKVSTKTLRKNYTRAEWIQAVKDELDNGRVLLVAGMTLEFQGNWHENNNVGGHWYHCDGYNEDGDFHVVVGFGDEDGYYDADSMSGFAFNLGILSGLEPELNGKELSLLSPDGGEIFCADADTVITWTSNNVSDIKIEYTLDNGENWLEIIASTPASTGTYTWTVPDTTSYQCKVKLTDVTEINVYDKSDSVFSILPYELTLITPNGGDCFVPTSSVSIGWENTPVSDIKIEYTIDNGSYWNEITDSTSAATGSYDWIIPDSVSSQCKVKITDITNGTVYDESDNTFEIVEINNIGGPYAVDNNTVLLLHFEGDLTNQSLLSDNGVPHGDGISFDPNTPTDLGHCLKLDNSNGSCYITIPHDANLNLIDDWTIEAWFYIETFGSGASENPTIISKSSGSDQNYFLWYHNNWSQIKGQYTNTFNTDKYVGIGNTVTSGQWYHIAYIKNSADSTETLLIHDQTRALIAEATVQQNLSQTIPLLNSEDVYIGKLFSGYNYYFDGYIDEVRISNVVRSFDDVLNADFSTDVNSGDIPLEVTFTDLSTPGDVAIDEWYWDFGDGDTSSLQNPVHIYDSIGLFTVSLTVTDVNDSTDTEVKTDYICVSAASGFNCGDLFTDPRDNQVYTTVLIDTMCWMAENINIGTRIDGVNEQTDNSIIEKYCYDNIEDSCDVYGGLYQWDEMMEYVTDTAAQGICPAGWHIPTDYEWKVLEGTVDSLYPVGDPEWDLDGWRGFDAGKNLKSINGWNDDIGADLYGFTALAAGRRQSDGAFASLGAMTYMWISKEYDGSTGWCRYLRSDYDNIRRSYFNKSDGRTVRCLYNNCTPQPTQADAGPDQLNVAGTSTALAGNTPTSGTGNWAIITGTGGTITDASSPTSGFSGLAGNSYELTWTITTVCGSSADTVVISFATGGFSCGDPLTDPRDGKVYATVQIGTQCWMAENMNIGTRIDGGIDQTDDGTIEKYCYDDSESNCDTYGGLYQWDEMMQYFTTEGVQGICPDGWSLPTDDEWKTLEGTVDGTYPVGDPIWNNSGWRGFDAGKNLKSVSGWTSNSGTDLYGFTALPGGMIEGSTFKDLIGHAYFWASTENGGNAWFRSLAHDLDSVYRNSFSKAFGCSVRCLKD